jgi:hypothetical protein
MAPRQARAGERAAMHGRVIVPGLAYPERTFSTRATGEEIWAALEIAGTPSGRKRVWGQHQGKGSNEPALRRFSAYLGQAQTFYTAAQGMDVLSRPLSGYYALLNLAKAWLTLADPKTTESKLVHGASDAYKAKQRYRFSQEALRTYNIGVLREIGSRSGACYAYQSNETISISALCAYLCESHEEYENSIGNYPKVLPIQDLSVLRGKVLHKAKETGALWLRAEIDRGLLKARKLNSKSLPEEAWHFSQAFEHVASDNADTLSFESKPILYGRNTTHAFAGLGLAYESSLIHTNRTGGSVRYFLILSKRQKLMSQEAVAFGVMLHLSNMVRYRPEQLEKLAGERWSWLLSTWVPRALENALLTYGTRIVGTELRVA